MSYPLRSTGQSLDKDPIIATLVRQRKEQGLRQQEVADNAGISRRALVSIEAGNDCTLSTLRSLCEALGVDLVASAASQDQADRELAEALSVRSMSPRELSDWLASGWGRLQDQANVLYRGVKRPSIGQPRYFANIEDKNRFDEERETEFALAVALSRR